MRLIIVGSTGLVGASVLKQAINASNIDTIHLLLRKPIKIDSHKIEQTIVDFDKGLPSAVFQGADAVICCLGTTMKKAKSRREFKKVDLTYVFNIAQECAVHNVGYFGVVSAAGANIHSMFFYNRIKGMMENKVRSLDIDKICIVRPSLLLGNREEQRFGEIFGAVFFKIISPFMICSLEKYKAIDASKVASSLLKNIDNQLNDVLVVESNDLQLY